MLVSLHEESEATSTYLQSGNPEVVSYKMVFEGVLLCTKKKINATHWFDVIVVKNSLILGYIILHFF